VLAQEVSSAIHALDRFHIMQAMNKVIDEMRAECPSIENLHEIRVDD
jgi:transposase